jgi:hypothetical protein
MPDTKFTFNDNKGFWIAEHYMQLAYHYIHQELLEPIYDAFSNKQGLILDCELKINGMQFGYFSVMWDEDLSNDADRLLMIQLINQVITNLQAKGDYITVEELKAIPTEDDHWEGIITSKPFPVNDLLKIFNAMIQVLNGTWESSNYNMDAEMEWLESNDIA